MVPEADPQQLSSCGPRPRSSNLYLFDPRLGAAVRNKATKKIATLKDVQNDPKLLEPSLISAANAKKLEAWLICPLQALSPRMLELQKGLSKHDAIVLYLPGPSLKQDIAKASGIPVRVWNANMNKDGLPVATQAKRNSPALATVRFTQG